MGAVIGIICILLAVFVGTGILLVANNNVRNFKDEDYVSFTDNSKR